MIKYLIIFLAILIIVLAGGLIFFEKIKPDYEIIKIKILDSATQSVKFQGEVEIADTAIERAKGLSRRKCLKDNNGICPSLAEGMLFLFKEQNNQSFWMAGMNFPLDIIWINGDKIVDISKNIQSPKSGELPAIVSPSMEVDKVLEISAGSVDKFDIKAGDKLEYD